MSPVSMSYGVIPGYVIFWVIFAVAVGLFLRRIYQLWRYLSLGQKEGGFGQILRRLLSTIVSVWAVVPA